MSKKTVINPKENLACVICKGWIASPMKPPLSSLETKVLKPKKNDAANAKNNGLYFDIIFI